MWATKMQVLNGIPSAFLVEQHLNINFCMQYVAFSLERDTAREDKPMDLSKVFTLDPYDPSQGAFLHPVHASTGNSAP